MPRLPRLTGADLTRLVEKQGFVFVRSRGSHHIFRHPESGRRVTIPVHSGKIIPPGTLLNILREAGISREELEDLLR